MTADESTSAESRSYDEVRTIAAPTTVEIERIKGSRFIGDAVGVSIDETALDFLAEVSNRESGASHHCWAYRLADGRERSSDAGEPGGTAGQPILRRIVGAGLHDVMVVVTRYYGGTNLGKGGLVRAYGAAAAAAIDAATVKVEPVMEAFTLAYPYELSSAIERAQKGHEAAVVDAEYGVAISLTVQVPRRLAKRFAAEVIEATAGRVTAEPVQVLR